MLNARGGIECDFTVTRLAETRFIIVTGTAFGQHDLAWIRQHVPEDGSVHVADVTSAFACFGLWGPLAREILQPLTTADLANDAFPYMQARHVAVGPVPCVALRVTYVGELGYELHVPVEFACTVYSALLEAGRGLGLAHGGYRAIESLRLEKGYRAWGADIGPDYTPLEAGLGFAVKLGTAQPFLGRAALEGQRTAGLSRRLACFTVDDPEVMLLGRETIYRDGAPVGWLSSGGYGYTVGKAIGYGYVRHGGPIDPAWLSAGRYELEVATERVPATLHLQALYDPKGRRIRQ
jgi:4-methylaminobutanoate oxidase (formaldehyde-forming)